MKEKQIKQKFAELITLFKGVDLGVNGNRLGLCLSVIAMHYHVKDLEQLTEILKKHGDVMALNINKVVDDLAKLN